MSNFSKRRPRNSEYKPIGHISSNLQNFNHFRDNFIFVKKEQLLPDYTHIIEHVHHGPDGLLHVLVLTVHLLWFLRMPSYVCYMKYIQCGNTFQALCSLIVA